MKVRTKTIAGLAVISILASVSYAYSARFAHTRSPKYVTATIDRGQIISKVTASGTLSALVTVQVGTQVSGRVSWIGVDFNSKVTKGQVIARIEPELFEAALDNAKASELAALGMLARGKYQASDARRKSGRARTLRTDQLVSEAEVDSAKASASAAGAQVQALLGAYKQAQAARKQAEINLAHTKIISPIDGVVISRSIDVGQTVAASLQSPTLFTIAEDLSKMQVDTYVAEADVGRIKESMEATFHVDAYPTKTFTGMIRQIRNAPQSSNNVVTYDAVIDVANKALELKPGMTANVSIVYNDVPFALRVPNAALRFRPSDDPLIEPAAPAQRSDVKTLWILVGGQLKPVQVDVGATDGTYTEIKHSPLGQGEEVVTDVLTKRSTAGRPGHNTNPYKRYF